MAKSKDNKNQKKNTKKSSGKGLIPYLKGVVNELKKVVWPTRKQLMSATYAVLLILAITTVYIGVLDTIFMYLFKLVS